MENQGRGALVGAYSRPRDRSRVVEGSGEAGADRATCIASACHITLLKNVSAIAESGRFHGRPNDLISQPLARARSAGALILPMLLLAACFLLTPPRW